MADTLPNPADPDTTRFESAPDGTLIPIPSEAPPGKPILDEARITVSPLRATGYYVEIYNGPPDPPSEVDAILDDFLSEAAMEAVEKALVTGAETVALKFLEGTLFIAGVLADVFTTSPLLNEQFYRGTMDDGTQVTYAILTPTE